MQSFINGNPKLKNYFPYIVCFIVSGLITLAFFSNVFQAYGPGFKTQNISLSTVKIAKTESENQSLERAKYNKDGIHIPKNGADIEFTNLNAHSKILEFSLKRTKPVSYVTGTVELEDFGVAPGYALASRFKITTGKFNTTQVRLESHGKLNKIKLHFNTTQSGIVVQKITINPKYNLHVNYAKWAILFIFGSAIITIRKKKWHKIAYNQSNRVQNIIFWIVCAIVTGFSLYIWFRLNTYNRIRVPFAYNTYDFIDGNPYTEQLKAWKQGSLSLLQDPPKGLLHSTNPFSIGKRMQLVREGTPAIWDVVLHNGKYYCYFGIVPFILTYLPFNALFPAWMPSAIMVTTAFAAITIPVLFALWKELIIFFSIKVNYCSMLLIAAALPFACLIFYLQASASIYYMPMVSAMLFGALFVYSSLKAVRLKNSFTQYALFVLSGLSLALQCGSRPNSCISTVAFIAPLFIALLLNNSRSIINRACAAISFLVPAIAGFAGILVYNYLRFGSFFNFGNEEQLTNFDLRFNRITFDPLRIKDMLINFFIKPPSVDTDFPYITITSSNISDYGNSFFNHMTFGLLSIPLIWGIFLIRRKYMQKIEYIMCLSGITFSIMLIYVNYCLGGSLYRYYCDSIIILMIIASIGFARRNCSDNQNAQLQLNKENACNNELNGQKSIQTLIVACTTVTIVFGFLLVFANHTESANEIQYTNPDAFVEWNQRLSVGF